MTARRVIVVGAGPAGVAAAIGASKHASVTLLDEQEAPGGHLLQAASSTAEHAPGPVDGWAARLGDHGVDYHSETSVWALLPGPSIASFTPRHAFSMEADAVIIATGTTSRQWPVFGWELGGVMDLDGWYTNEASQDRLVAIIGVSPHVDEAARVIENTGGSVAVQTTDLGSARILGTDAVEGIEDASGITDVDCVVLAFGRLPDPMLALQARVLSCFDRGALVEMPLLGSHGETSMPGVYLAGEAAGVGPNEAAAHAAIVGEVAARGEHVEVDHASLRPPKLYHDALSVPTDPETVISREQGVTLGDVLAAMERGAHDANDLRKVTRAGMGARDTRTAMAVLAALLMKTDPGITDERLIGRVRPPARPLPFRIALNTIAAD